MLASEFFWQKLQDLVKKLVDNAVLVIVCGQASCPQTITITWTNLR